MAQTRNAQISPKRFGVMSYGITRIPHLKSFLAGEWERLSFFKKSHINAVVTWGLRPNSKWARAYALKKNLPLISLEDGFLRSIDLGVNGAPPLSMVKDDLGIYYDASQPSRLEKLISQINFEDNLQLKDQAQKALDLVLHHKLSKYNLAPHIELEPKTKKRVLLVDQTLNDASIQYGGATQETFRHMLQTAIDEDPDSEIWIKTHPDVVSGKKLSNFESAKISKLITSGRIRLIAQEISTDSILQQVDRVFVVTSHVGFEALMRGLPVRCFAWPWYAGWGLTQDSAERDEGIKLRRSEKRTTLQLFAAAYLQYSHYIEPETGKPGSVFDVIEYLALNKQHLERTRGTLYCVGLSLWKRAVVKPFLQTLSNRIRFVSLKKVLKKKDWSPEEKVLTWGQKNQSSLVNHLKSLEVSIWHMEDGFVRSVGLGSELRRPYSLVLDQEGIYYDPNSKSELEKILQNSHFSKDELKRAQRFREKLLKLRLSKYNVGAEKYQRPSTTKKIILIAGQVEDDASIVRGSPQIQTNRELLVKVRELNPNAYLIYKPHPDVVSGNRSANSMKGFDLNLIVDEILEEVAIIDLIEHVDEVHSMTSLVGFEALLRAKKVVCYGAPFYAGWGLTEDKVLIPHRTRTLSLEELIAAVLLKYPSYWFPHSTSGLVRPEKVLDYLYSEKLKSETISFNSHSYGTSYFSRQIRKSKELIKLLQR